MSKSYSHRAFHQDRYRVDEITAADALAKQACKERNIFGGITLHRRTPYTATYWMNSPLHGPLAIRVDLNHTSGFAGQNLRVAEHLVKAGISIFPPFDFRTTVNRAGHSASVWKRVANLKEGIGQVDPAAAGLMLSRMHKVHALGVRKSHQAQGGWWKDRWKAVMSSVASQPHHPLHNLKLAAIIDERVRLGFAHVRDYMYSLIKETRDSSLLHGDWPSNFAEGEHPDTHKRTTMLNDFQHSAAGPIHLDLWMGISALLLRPEFTRDHYQTFRASYGDAFPSELELVPFGIISTLNRLMFAAECIAANRPWPDPHDSWDSIGRKVIHEPGGDPLWRDLCRELAGSRQARVKVPDSHSFDRWPKDFGPKSMFS